MQPMKVLTDLDPEADPFGEHAAFKYREQRMLMGAQVEFSSNSAALMRLVRTAYAHVPAHRLHAKAPRLSIVLQLSGGVKSPARRTAHEPAQFNLLQGAGLLAGGSVDSNFTVLSPRTRSALVAVSRAMLAHPYHLRYELIEFAVYTLATRVQGLVPLHAACIGRRGKGVLLLGNSGAGKSTLTLLSLFQDIEFLAEDSVFIEPQTLRATGIANFLHVRAESLRWLTPQQRAWVQKSPVITRRSGVKKFEVNLRRRFSLAPRPLAIEAVVFLSPQSAQGPLLAPLSRREVRARLAGTQAYGSTQPGWAALCRGVDAVGGFELKRGEHPHAGLEALGRWL